MSHEPINAADRDAASLRLRGEDVLVRVRPSEEVRASGLVVPATVTENFLGMLVYGTVVAVDPGRTVTKGPRAGEVEPLPWKPGEHVAFRQGFSVEINLRDGVHHIVGHGPSAAMNYQNRISGQESDLELKTSDTNWLV